MTRNLKSIITLVFLANLASASDVAFADAGIGPHLFDNPLEWLVLLAEMAGVAFLVYLVFVLLATLFLSAHVVFIVFCAYALYKKTWRGKGLRYSAVILLLGYAGLVALVYSFSANPHQ